MYCQIGHRVGIRMTTSFLGGKIGKMQLAFTEMGVTSGEQDVGTEAAGIRA